MLNPSYLPPLKFVEVVRVLQIALSGVSVFSVNINEDAGVGPGSQHVTSEDTHFIGVDCQTTQGMSYTSLTCRILHVGQETVSNQTLHIYNISTE